MLAEIAAEELAAALDEQVAATLADAAVAGPPVDARAVAAALEIAVGEDDRQPGRARIVTRPAGMRPRAMILVRPDPRDERRHWATAHEIGEHLAHQVFARLGIDARECPPRAREQVANALANRLLLPRDWFLADAAACHWSLPELKRAYATASHELIARRMLDFSPPVIVTVLDHGRITWRRANVPGRVPPLSPLERRCWAIAHEGTASEASDAAQAVAAWPVHEPGWRREILRTAIDVET